MTETPETPGLLQSKYSITHVLAMGGMSTVFKAREKKTSEPVVIKELHAPAVTDENLPGLLKKEYALLRTLTHPHIPRVYEYLEDPTAAYMVEEYIEGTTLKACLAEKKSTDLPVLAGIMFQVAAVLHYLNGRGIIYRDLKPSNIIIDQRGLVRLVDFGAARRYRKGKKRDTVQLGTPGFASPEHYGYGQTDERSDVYSAGALLYYLLTGCNPCDEPFVFRFPSGLNHEIHEGFSTIVMKATAIKPVERFASIKEFRKALFDAVCSACGGIRMIFCPLCWIRMTSIAAGEVEVDECSLCRGIWCDARELEDLELLEEEEIPATFNGSVQNQASEDMRGSDPGRIVHCPLCGELMKSFRHTRKPVVLLDRCPSGCGTWLDGGR